MRELVVTGGVPLRGTLRPLGAKNAALALLAACVLLEGPAELRHVPDLRDVRIMLELLAQVGAQVAIDPDEDGQLKVTVDASGPLRPRADLELMSRLRSSVYFLGALVGRLGQAQVGYPGGCAIGERPIDLHLWGLHRLGVVVEQGPEDIRARATPPAPEGAYVRLPFPSVGATVNLLLAAVRARGVTVVEGAAQEPEIVDLARFLRSAGAVVKGAGTSRIQVRGVNHLYGTSYTVMPDRIEAGTLLLMAAGTGGDLEMAGPVAAYLQVPLQALAASGARVEVQDQRVRVEGPPDGRPLPLALRTEPYPGLPTDLQPVFMAYLTRARGVSVVQETIFERRMGHAQALRRLGARIRVVGRTAVVDGVARLEGAEVAAADLRAAGALVAAALMAEGTSAVQGLGHLERGYQDMEGRLRALGAQVYTRTHPAAARVS
jgi:UDP-N-acetylglucosamine 1-carboxyvinyltransferase